MNLSDDEMRRLYSSGYFEGEEYLDYEKEKPALQKNFQRRLATLRKLHSKGAKLWEIGAAYGFFLDVAKEFFTVAGCDISDHATKHAREKLGLDVACGDYLAMAPPDEAFDIICLWDTVEHLRNPEAYLRKAANELKAGGTLVLSTGDIGATLPRLQGAAWRLIHPPTHLHYFTAKSITTMLEGFGLKDVKVEYHAFWRSADAVAYRLLSTPESKWSAPVYRALRSLGLLGFFFPVNTFDLMTVTARKGKGIRIISQ